ncbi:myosin light chain kinase 3 [Gastrophryne carolinensis]
MSKQESITSCLAKMYENKFDHSAGTAKSPAKPSGAVNGMDRKLNLLNEKMDKLLHFQEDVMSKLDVVSHGLALQMVGQNPKEDMTHLKSQNSFSELIGLIKMVHEESLIQQEKLAGLEKMVSTIDKVVAFVGNTLKNSKIVDFIVKGTIPWKKEVWDEAKDNSEEKESKPKHVLASRVSQLDVQGVPSATPQKTSPSEDRRLSQNAAHCNSPRNNGQSLEIHQHHDSSPGAKHWAQKVAGERMGEKSVHTGPDAQHSQTPHSPTDQKSKLEEPKKIIEELKGDLRTITQQNIIVTPPLVSENCIQRKVACTQTEDTPASSTTEASMALGNKPKSENRPKPTPKSIDVTSKPKQTLLAPQITPVQKLLEKEPLPNQKLGHTDLKQEKDTNKIIQGAIKLHITDFKKNCDPAPPPSPIHPIIKPPPEPTTALEASSMLVIDDCPPPPAPFNHRIVSIKQAVLSSCYTVRQHEVLGGGRFGQVHKCVEISSGLRLAAKIIKVKGPKDRDEVKNEINVMNQLNHVNLIQLYDAFECKNDLTLIMECLDGGELFDRITDENYHMTELDAIMFTRQICEGIYYLHQQYILHLDLKPENILCVNHTGHQIKIIDFGLARRYKPREKLKVNFGTPEFLAPEVVNYDFVSFPTDMWSIGVITYMLLSGLSPFLGESDAETMNYIVNCNWDFDSETFSQVSEEAKDFISRLLVKEKSGRMSAGQCLKHEWLTELALKAQKYKVRLKSQLLLQRYMTQKKWKKHFYVVTAANRLRKFQLQSLKPS